MIPTFCKLCGGEGEGHACTGKPSEYLKHLVDSFHERLTELEKLVDEFLKTRTDK